MFFFLAYSTKLNKFPVFNINDDLNDLCTSAVSPNTTKATRYALNVWRYWCMTNGLKDHTDITKVRNSWLYFSLQPALLSLPVSGRVLSTGEHGTGAFCLGKLGKDPKIEKYPQYKEEFKCQKIQMGKLISLCWDWQRNWYLNLILYFEKEVEFQENWIKTWVF